MVRIPWALQGFETSSENTHKSHGQTTFSVTQRPFNRSSSVMPEEARHSPSVSITYQNMPHQHGSVGGPTSPWHPHYKESHYRTVVTQIKTCFYSNYFLTSHLCHYVKCCQYRLVFGFVSWCELLI